MKKTLKRILCSVLSLTLVGTLGAEYALGESIKAGNDNGASGGSAVSFTDVTGEFDVTALRAENFNAEVIETGDNAVYETRSVIVELKGDTLAEKSENEKQRYAQELREKQDAFLRELSSVGISFKEEKRYDTLLNGVSIEIDTKYVSRIKQMATVKRVVIPTTYLALETTEGEIVNGTGASANGIYDVERFTSGAQNYDDGTVVAVLDTGVDYTHEAFSSQPSAPAWSRSTVENLLASNALKAEDKTSGLGVQDVYVSSKIPFAYDYADNDTNVYSSLSDHGTHVAGIIGGYDANGYTDADGNAVGEAFRGVLPDAQLVICKVFTDELDDGSLSGARTSDVLAALEDCVTLGVDVINMSLGSSCGFSTTDDGDPEGELLASVYEKIENAGINLVCAAGNAYSAGYGSALGMNGLTNPDTGTVSSPSTYSAALSVASLGGQPAPYMVYTDGKGATSYAYYSEVRGANGKDRDFAKQLLGTADSAVLEYAVVPGKGAFSDYTSETNEAVKGRLALIERGENSFKEKVEIAMAKGATGVIVYNNVTGGLRIDLSALSEPIPCVSVNMETGASMCDIDGDGNKDLNKIGKITLAKNNTAGPFMSEFSSWGPTHDLRLKPELTAYGGSILSAVTGGYGVMSGTSMASPNVAAITALVRQYVKSEPAFGIDADDKQAVSRLANQLLMSTATLVKDESGIVYSPRKQGAGLGNPENAIGNTSAYLSTSNADNGYRPKLELFDDAEKTGVYGDADDPMTFRVTNFGTKALKFAPEQWVLTQTLAKNSLSVTERAYELSPSSVEWTANGTAVKGEIEVAAGSSVEIAVKITLSQQDKQYLERFPDGTYVEGFLSLRALTDGQCDLNLPFLGFYGDWEKAQMLDVSAYEVAASQKDPLTAEEEKLAAQIWATQPYVAYYNGKYSLPMGNYLYELGEGAEKPYANEEYNAVSRYNEYYGEDDKKNYMSSTSIKSVYAGLLRNARVMRYTVYNADTGEAVYSSEYDRVSKAYADGGNAVAAKAKLGLAPEQAGLVGNGKYRVDIEFYMNDPEEYTLIWDGTDRTDITDYNNAKGEYSFTFTVDYEAPVLQDACIRYQTYKDGGKIKQKIYLDVDVFDNHYAQAVMLCYETKDKNGETVLQLATEYPTPILAPNGNGTTTVAIEITDIYEEYGDSLYVYLDDYALNGSLYRIDANEANRSEITGGGFFVLGTDEEGKITLPLYQTKQIELSFGGSGDESNFVWTSDDPSVVAVRNGELAALQVGTAEITVSDRRGHEARFTVEVLEETTAVLAQSPSISFGVIRSSNGSLVKPSASNDHTVRVKPNEEFVLTVEKEPWYYPMDGFDIEWSSTDDSVVSVKDGLVKTVKEGAATVTAALYKTDEEGKRVFTGFTASVTLRVDGDFEVKDRTLVGYNGIGYNEGTNASDGVLVIPADLNIKYIAKGAFKDNDTIRRVVIPATVEEIGQGAFENCSALQEVYFVSKQLEKEKAALSVIRASAFYNCTELITVDLTNTERVTLGERAFAGCSKLTTVINMPAVHSALNYAFYNCASLQKADLTGLYKSGSYVFKGCVGLTEIVTDKFTEIGEYMFDGCTGLREAVTIRTAKLGKGAFYNCHNLEGVVFAKASDNSSLCFEIGAETFRNAGNKASGFTVNLADVTVASIGDRAFKGSGLKGRVTLPNGLRSIGANVFASTTVNTVEIGDGFDDVLLLGEAFTGLEIAVASNATSYAVENGVIYTATDGKPTKALLVNSSVTGELTLPKSVREIAPYAFAGSNITKLSLPLGASDFVIGEGAFMGSKLKEFSFNDAHVEEVPAYAFAESALTSITLSHSVKTIGAHAFENSELTYCLFLNGLEKIGDRAFAGCTKLFANTADAEALTLPSTLVELGDGVFDGATSLRRVEIPSAEKIGRGTFIGATSLKLVWFGPNVKDTGTYTLEGSSAENVRLADSAVTEIGEGFLKGNTSIVSVQLPNSVVAIGDRAFEGCKKLYTVPLEGVVTIGDYAFYDTDISKLSLLSATKIGAYAFASERTMTNESGETVAILGNYQKVELPNVEEIGAFAFMSGGETEIVLPDSVKKIGMGAFSRSTKLLSVTFADGKKGNGSYVSVDNVLYRYVNGEESVLELVCYPGGLAAKDASYTVLEGTIRIEAYAFYGVGYGNLTAVVLPYTLKTIGDAAFFETGVRSYYFQSIRAPKLETSYRKDIADKIAAVLDDHAAVYYRGYYYSNFQKYIFNYSEFGGETSYLRAYYPENGIGYDSFLYDVYFGNEEKTGIHATQATRDCIERLTALDVSQLDAWLGNGFEVNAENKATVEAFAATLKTLRTAYNAVMRDEAQTDFIDASLTDKLTSVEAKLRQVKEKFGIAVKIESIEVAADSAHKASYISGEKFNATGLRVIVIYDDGSVKEVAWGDKNLKIISPTKGLTKYDSIVTVGYLDGEGYVSIVVTDPPVENIADEGVYTPTITGLGIAIMVVGGVFIMLGGVGLYVFFIHGKIRKKDS